MQNKMNRRDATEAAQKILKTFEGMWVDATVYGVDENPNGFRTHKMIIPALKARKSNTVVELVLSFPSRDSEFGPKAPVRQFSVELAQYHEEDMRWTVTGQYGSLKLDLEPYLMSPEGISLKSDPDTVALGVVAGMEAVKADGYREIKPDEKLGSLRKWARVRLPKAERYYAQLIQQQVWGTEYAQKAVAMVTPEGSLRVIATDEDLPFASATERDLQALIESSGGPEEVLDYLYDRNSTRTAYAKPVTMNGYSPEQVAHELSKREGEQP